MTQQNKILLIVFLLFFGMGVAVYWIYSGNRGTLTINLHPPFNGSISHYRQFTCDTTPCHFSVPYGKRELCINKEGYYRTCENIMIPWRKEISFSPQLKKIPEIVNTEEKEDISIEIAEEETHIIEDLYPDWSKAQTDLGKYYAYNPVTHDIFRVYEDGETNLIVRMTDIEMSSFFSFRENLVVLTESEVYFIDTQKRAKYRVYSGKKLDAKVQENQVYFSDGEHLFHLNAELLLMEKTPFFTDLELVSECYEQIFYSVNEESRSVFYRYNEEDESSEKISSARISTDFSLECGSDKNEIGIVFADGEKRILRF